ncbi:hypothetical protein, partial [Acinetobacter sp. TUM15051]|uniref:hypothetical protein n=1 Tax=Acinetobacter sp. TUM15051 TaxID=2609132 RepID=UPI001D19356A
MIAENWGDSTLDFLGTTFDSTMNYLFRNAVVQFVLDEPMESKYAFDNFNSRAEEIWRPIDAQRADQLLMLPYEKYPREAFYALMNLLGSHDVPRILRVFGDIETDRLLYPGQKDFIADKLGINRSQMSNV